MLGEIGKETMKQEVAVAIAMERHSSEALEKITASFSMGWALKRITKPSTTSSSLLLVIIYSKFLFMS